MNKLFIVCLMIVAMTACGGSQSKPTVNLSSSDIICNPMGDCMAKAFAFCNGPFQMKVQDGTQSAPTVSQWRPSPVDNQFHLFISCQ